MMALVMWSIVCNYTGNIIIIAIDAFMYTISDKPYNVCACAFVY